MSETSSGPPPTGLGFHEAFLGHLDAPGARGHPERPERLGAVLAGLESSGILGRLARFGSRRATRSEIERVHDPGVFDRVRAAGESGFAYLDPDTPVSSRSLDAALLAAGLGIEAVDGVLDGTYTRAFLALRPPGHHATRDRSMGFCLFNNIAVAAAHALDRGAGRVAILDWDVHHGNGTQDIFYESPRVLFVSLHQYPLYPGTGSTDECGEGAGRGLTLNLPLAPGSGDDIYLQCLDHVVHPAFRSFRPDLILISAGFDAHEGDPLAGMRISTEGFRQMTVRVARWSEALCRGRVLSFLEGGYALEALRTAVPAHVEALTDLRRE